MSPHTLAEQGWKSFDGVDEDKWIEEGRLLIEPGDDEEDEDVEPGSHRKPPESDEDEEDIVDIWSMSKDQQEYYGKQFRSLLESNGDITKVSGAVAKEFFVRSKLTSSELANIWQLADIDKDGSLNLAEFSIAMHLVVLRKKACVDVPSTLPKSLVSSALKISPAVFNHTDDGNHFNGTKNQTAKSNSSGNLIDMSVVLVICRFQVTTYTTKLYQAFVTRARSGPSLPILQLPRKTSRYFQMIIPCPPLNPKRPIHSWSRPMPLRLTILLTGWSTLIFRPHQ